MSLRAVRSTSGEPAGCAAISARAFSTQCCGALPCGAYGAAVQRKPRPRAEGPGLAVKRLRTIGRIQRLIGLPVADDACRIEVRLRQEHLPGRWPKDRANLKRATFRRGVRRR